MPRPGQAIENPITGERIVFLHTGPETSGEYTEFDHYLNPGPSTFPEHVQQNQEERFEIVSGAARYRLGGAERQAGPGEVVVIAPGTRHLNCWNPGPERLHMRHSFRPALGADDFWETLFALARLGKTNRKGEVNLLQLAVIGSEIESQTYGAGVPLWLQRLGLPVLAGLGRLLGYRARYT
jgi:mannose-6-phosphate isomerase-like protein (cupin superfamily)